MLKCYRIIKITGFLLFFLYTFIPLTFAGEDIETGFWSSFQENLSPSLDINLRGAYYYKDSPFKPNDFHLSGNATAHFTRDLFGGILLRVDPRVNFDTIYTKGTRLFIEDRDDRPAFTLYEAILSWYGESTEIELGKKIYSWKVADGFSPLDIINPVDIIELMDPEKIGIPSISILKIFDLANIQMVFLPFFVPDRQPNDQSRWISDDPEGRAAFISRFGVAPVNVDIGRALPDDKFDKMSFASRISTSTLFTGWDLAFVYKYGYSSRGVIRNDINILTLPQVQQTTEYPAYNLYGFSFSTVAGDIEYHGEIAFHDTRDNLKDEDYISYIVGINYTNYEFFVDYFDEIRFVAEYAGEDIIKKRSAGSTFSGLGVSRGLTGNTIGSIEFKINEDHSFKPSFIYNFANEDSMLDVYVESQLNDYLEIIYGYQRLSGDDASFFGQWDRNDRVYIKMSIKF